MTWEALESNRTHKAVAVEEVLTEKERILSRLSVAEVDSGSANAHAVRFPASNDTKAALAALAKKECNFVQLKLDLAKETIELADRCSIDDLSELQGKISTTEPRFSLFCWNHENGGANVTSHVFVYSCPDNANVKAKMLYSTVKSVAIDTAQSSGVAVDAKLEIQTPDEWNAELMGTTLHPEEVAAVKLVARPKPGGRGPRRQIK